MIAPPPWSAGTFEAFLSAPDTVLVTSGRAFALGRVIADEAELLTIAVDPEARGGGLGRACLAAFEKDAATRGAARAFLEVSRDNTAARALYASAGFREDGVRRGYYRAADGTSADAILMSKPLGLA